jgi:hypothetical protein
MNLSLKEANVSKPEASIASAEHDPHETNIEIVINGTRHTVNERKLSYEQLVDLAYEGSPPTAPNTIIVVTYTHGQSPEKGSVVKGQEVPVHKGMVFNVYDATES